ncbi:uncharacterized protein BJX67DRAFT_87220 [Aspergillus lucknowensis]|uniref:Uncharacterized protein n=1 Tax=Aspergillus lucknowensis TaxID=176173 RepID=A0ABR4M5B8_9EURO
MVEGRGRVSVKGEKDERRSSSVTGAQLSSSRNTETSTRQAGEPGFLASVPESLGWEDSGNKPEKIRGPRGRNRRGLTEEVTRKEGRKMSEAWGFIRWRGGRSGQETVQSRQSERPLHGISWG